MQAAAVPLPNRNNLMADIQKPQMHFPDRFIASELGWVRIGQLLRK